MLLQYAVKKADFIVGHNVDFDVNVLGCEFFRQGQRNTDWTEIPSSKYLYRKDGNSMPNQRWQREESLNLPTLSELHLKLIRRSFC